jgi:hypothetical protein
MDKRRQQYLSGLYRFLDIRGLYSNSDQYANLNTDGDTDTDTDRDAY